MTLQGGQQATVVMPVVSYSDGSKRILVNSQNATWKEDATETDGELYIDTYPIFNSCNALDANLRSGDFDSGYADEAIDMSAPSTYPLMVPSYSLTSCSVHNTPNAVIRISFEGGYIEGTTDLDSQDITFDYSALVRDMIYEIKPRKIGSKYYLHFWDGVRWNLMCDATTAKAIRCTSQGITHIDIKANCTQGIEWSADALESVHADHEVYAELGWNSCSLDDGEMDMTMTLTMAGCMATSRETHVLINSQGGYLIPAWELVYV